MWQCMPNLPGYMLLLVMSFVWLGSMSVDGVPPPVQVVWSWWCCTNGHQHLYEVHVPCSSAAGRTRLVSNPALRPAAAGNRLKSAQAALPRKSRFSSKADEARDILANLIICHVPCVHFDFGPKVSWCRRKLVTCWSAAGPSGVLHGQIQPVETDQLLPGLDGSAHTQCLSPRSAGKSVCCMTRPPRPCTEGCICLSDARAAWHGRLLQHSRPCMGPIRRLSRNFCAWSSQGRPARSSNLPPKHALAP